MKKNSADKFRLYPNVAQRVYFAKCFGCARFVYNALLAERKKHYAATKEPMFSRYSPLKKAHAFLYEVDNIALAWAQQHLDKAFRDFARKPDTGFPKFKSKHKGDKSYQTCNQKGNIRIEGGRIKLPKIGFVKIVQHREIPKGWRIKTVTVSQNAAGEYYASIQFEYESQAPESVKPKSFLGLDYSMPELYIPSEGDVPHYPRYYRKSQDRLAVEQRRLSKMTRGSHNWKRQKRRVNRVSVKVANQRKDFLHKKSTELADRYDVIGVEDIDMRGMARSMNFGKSVMDNGWGMFRTFLKYKMRDRGKYLVKIDRFFPSSKRCHECGHVKSDLALSDREWVCPECGTKHERDRNAALNIRDEAKRMLLSGDFPAGGQSGSTVGHTGIALEGAGDRTGKAEAPASMRESA